MKSGFLPKTERQASDELIAGTERDPAMLAELTDAEPPGGEAPEAAPADNVDEPELAEARS